MSNKSLIVFLAVGHGLNDLVAGYFLGTLVQDGKDLAQVGLGLLVYNLLAFGGQYFVALWLEKQRNPKLFMQVAYLLNVAAIALFVISPQWAIVMAGIASAVYHVAGGTVCATDNKAINIGLFAAPGVAGLIAGGYFAWAQVGLMNWLLVAGCLFLVILSFLKIAGSKSVPAEPQKEGANNFSLDRHDIIMIILLTVISLRSVIWNTFQLVHDKEYDWLIAIAVAAFAGKIVGGWVADRIGWRLYIYVSLLTAAPLVTLFKKEMVLFCIGIGLLQSGIPATTALLIQSVKGKTERAIGLSFGTAIIAGALAFYTPLRSAFYSGIVTGVLILIMLLLMYFINRSETLSRSGSTNPEPLNP